MSKSIIMSTDFEGDMDAAKFQRIIDGMKSAYRSVGEKLLEFAKLYLYVLAAGGKWVRQLKEEFKDIPDSKWEQFELVGTGKMAAGLIVYSYGGQHLLKKLPVRDQETLLSKPVEVIIKDEKGNTDVLKVEFRNMTNEQRQQVISFDHIRTPEEQKAYLESKRTETWLKKNPPENKSYVIRKGKILFRKDTEFSQSELWDIIKELTGSKK